MGEILPCSLSLPWRRNQSSKLSLTSEPPQVMKQGAESQGWHTLWHVSPRVEKGSLALRAGLYLFSLFHFIYQILTPHRVQGTILSPFPMLTHATPPKNSRRQVLLSSQFTNEKTEDSQSLRTLPRDTQLVSNGSGFEPRQCDSRPRSEPPRPCHLMIDLTVSALDVLPVVGSGLIGG